MVSKGGNLERLCERERDGIRVAPPQAGIERIEAQFKGNGFSPHRHDTYAVGLTLRGVQTFSYRGSLRFSMPGQIIVLHPDELHDGAAGTETGLQYRMTYIPPEKIHAALDGIMAGLPFVSVAILDDPTFRTCLVDFLEDLDQEIEPLKMDSFTCALADCLQRHGDAKGGRKASGLLDWARLDRCREFLRTHAGDQVHSRELEDIAGMDRFALARQFRIAFGTSPHRYQVMRRLEMVKVLISRGESLAGAAIGSGFSDQSHMARHFKKAFGMTPGHWQKLSAVNAA